ncbi:MAG: amidohydrolase family protein [Elusimicrobia bacterium]|nr:amidohydrolase family protein [Elusimicrobiota bacterium]
MIIDFHTHAFPDNIAAGALEKIAYSAKIKPSFDGTVSGLLKSMDDSGIEKSVILNIATKPEQVENIIKWCVKIKSNRIIPFASIHPENKGFKDLLKRIKGEQLLGVKLHPMYQNFSIDSDKMFFIYEEIARNNLILILHTGFDIAFGEDKRAAIGLLKKVIKRFPELRIVASHTGGWRMWDEVLKELTGLNIWFETSMTLKYIKDKKVFLDILIKHSADRIMFGTDTPWSNQKEEVEMLKNLEISPDLKNKIFFQNAQKFLTL